MINDDVNDAVHDYVNGDVYDDVVRDVVNDVVNNSGSIPSSFGSLALLTYVTLSRNKLTGQTKYYSYRIAIKYNYNLYMSIIL